MLRLSLRQVDRLAEAGKLKKRKLSASRSGFDREDLDTYLKSLTANNQSYHSPFSAVAFVASSDMPINVNRIAETVDRILHQSLPGCLVHVLDGDIEVFAAMRGVNFVFHAAALKQVPSCEFYPMEAVRTNVIGTENMLNSAIAAGVERIVCLSTDKAVYPVNAMGISKISFLLDNRLAASSVPAALMTVYPAALSSSAI